MYQDISCPNKMAFNKVLQFNDRLWPLADINFSALPTKRRLLYTQKQSLR